MPRPAPTFTAPATLPEVTRRLTGQYLPDGELPFPRTRPPELLDSLIRTMKGKSRLTLRVWAG